MSYMRTVLLPLRTCTRCDRTIFHSCEMFYFSFTYDASVSITTVDYAYPLLLQLSLSHFYFYCFVLNIDLITIKLQKMDPAFYLLNVLFVSVLL